MGDTLKIEGSCDMDMMYDHYIDGFTCNTCPFNAGNEDSGCSISYDARLVRTLPSPSTIKQTESDFKHLDTGYAKNVKGYLGESYDIVTELIEYGKKGLTRTRVVLTFDDAKKFMNLFMLWNPSDDKLEELKWNEKDYNASCLTMITILRRAVLLEKGVIIYL